MRPCPKCGGTEAALSWFTMGNGTRHIREECAACGKWISWAPQTVENIRAAKPERPTDEDPSGTPMLPGLGL